MTESRTIRLVRVPECDLARGRARKSVYVRTLHRACVILGGFDALARHLGVPGAELRPWLQGRTEPPYLLFLAAVEILLLDAERSGASN
jgi:hypothetical protein